MKILIVTNLQNECSIEDVWIGNSFIEDGHDVKLVNKYYDKSLEDEYDIFIKRYSWIEDENEFTIGADESDYETRILEKNLPRINFDGKFDNQGKGYLSNLYSLGYSVVPTVCNVSDIDKLGKCDTYLIKPINGYASYGIVEAKHEDVKGLWNHNYVIQPKINFESEVQFYFIGNKYEYAQIFTPKKLLSHDNAEVYNPTPEEIKLATLFATLNGENFNGVQRIDFLKSNEKLLLSELEDDSPYMDIESLPEEKKKEFIEDFKQMVYDYYYKFKKQNGYSKILKR